MLLKRQKGIAVLQLILWLLVLVNTVSLGCYYYVNYVKANEIPNMIGSWKGQNLTVSDLKGYKTWDNKIGD